MAPGRGADASDLRRLRAVRAAATHPSCSSSPRRPLGSQPCLVRSSGCPGTVRRTMAAGHLVFQSRRHGQRPGQAPVDYRFWQRASLCAATLWLWRIARDTSRILHSWIHTESVAGARRKNSIFFELCPTLHLMRKLLGLGKSALAGSSCEHGVRPSGQLKRGIDAASAPGRRWRAIAAGGS